MQKTITMATIAKAAGVSQGAISSLLNDRDYGIRVSEKTRERVFKTCRELGYIPNDLRAVVRIYPEMGDTCLFLSSKVKGGMANTFAARIAGGIINTVTTPKQNLAVSMYDETRDYSNENDKLPPPLSNGTASKFIFVGSPSPSLQKVCIRRSYPVFQIGCESSIPGVTSIIADYESAARIALSHLLEFGHKNIAIVGGPFGSPDPCHAELNRAIGMAAYELGIHIAPQNIFQGNLSFEAGFAALGDALSKTPAPTALFCLSEAAGCGVLTAALTKGIKVPSELSIIALAEHADTPAVVPQLSTVALPTEELGILAAQEAERLIRGALPLEARKIIQPVKLLQRSTSGTAPK